MFATAALVELCVELSHLPLPSLRKKIRRRVADVIDALEAVPKSVSLRGLSWAICVAAASAEDEKQLFFKSLIKEIMKDTIPGFTNFDTVLTIVENCWSRRLEAPHEHWTWRTTMNSMGICALLL